MRGDSVYLEGRFTLVSFLFARHLRYLVLFNPEAAARQVPADALEAIMAHELAHIEYYDRRRRIALLGLIRLVRASFTVRFERGADLRAIALGYGPGLESYRRWLYRNIPASRIAQKKRDYFSPEEIEAILRAARDNPQMMDVFTACVPRSLAEIGAPCTRY
jgi:integrase